MCPRRAAARTPAATSLRSAPSSPGPHSHACKELLQSAATHCIPLPSAPLCHLPALQACRGHDCILALCWHAQLNTKDILFVCGGAFVGLDRLVAERTSEASLGFGNPVRSLASLDSS